MKKIIIGTVIFCVACVLFCSFKSSYDASETAETLLEYKINGDSAKFVNLYAVCDYDVIRKYEHIRKMHELEIYKANQVKEVAIKAWSK